MEEKVLEILRNVLDMNSVDKTCSQATCKNWDSMAQLNIVVELETEFDVILNPEDIVEMKSYADIIRLLNK